MSIFKKLFAARDAAPAVLFTLDSDTSENASPLVKESFNPGFEIPKYDKIGLSYTGNDLTQVDYTLSSVTVATIVLGYTSSVLTSVERTL